MKAEWGEEKDTKATNGMKENGQHVEKENRGLKRKERRAACLASFHS